jgi:hypothetical protein
MILNLEIIPGKVFTVDLTGYIDVLKEIHERDVTVERIVTACDELVTTLMNTAGADIALKLLHMIVQLVKGTTVN